MKYTFFMEWNGGTFLSQYDASCLKKAIDLWALGLNFSSIGANPGSKEMFLKAIENETVTIVNGLASVWCIAVFIEDCMALVHIVKTEGDLSNDKRKE